MTRNTRRTAASVIAALVLSATVSAQTRVDFLKYGREYEREADTLGAQIMARAGYDPRHMANMFRTIQRQGGGRGPEWLSSHPDPGNRYNAINREASTLRVSGAANTGPAFQSVRSRLARMPSAPSAQQLARR